MTTKTLCRAFLAAQLAGNFSPDDQFKIALYRSSADLNHDTEFYSGDGEVSGSGYVAGGKVLTGLETGNSGPTAWMSWSNPTWPGSTITARFALVYDASRSNLAVCVLDMVFDQVTTSTAFTVLFPAATEETALIRIVAQ